MTPFAKRQAIAELHEPHGLPVRQACAAGRLSRAAFYRPPDPSVRVERDQPVVDALREVVAENPRLGFWKCFDILHLAGSPWNPKRVHRVYCALRLTIPRRPRRRIPQRVKYPLRAPMALNIVWAMDFLLDALYDGRRFRTLNIIDESNREGLAVEIGTTMPRLRVIAVLEELIALHGKPKYLRVDNGPELRSLALTAWCEARGIVLRYIQPGRPSQNACIERFNRTYRTEILDAYVFTSLADVRELTSGWLYRYNTQRPHDSLGRVPPLTYRPRPTALPESTSEWTCPDFVDA